jgi:hypothetical protein
MAGDAPMVMAGLWAKWKSPTNGEEVLSCTILTCGPNKAPVEFIDAIHVVGWVPVSRRTTENDNVRSSAPILRLFGNQNQFAPNSVAPNFAPDWNKPPTAPMLVATRSVNGLTDGVHFLFSKSQTFQPLGRPTKNNQSQQRRRTP